MFFGLFNPVFNSELLRHKHCKADITDYFQKTEKYIFLALKNYKTKEVNEGKKNIF